MNKRNLPGRWALAGIAAASAAAIVGALSIPSAMSASVGFLSTSLQVGTIAGPDAPLVWKSTTAINEPSVLSFRWSTTDSDVGSAKWQVYQAGQSAPVASGSVGQIPAPGEPAIFKIDFKKFVPAQAPANGIKYTVTVSTFFLSPKITKRGAPPPKPISTSPIVTVAYVRPGAATKFDDDMGYSSRRIKIELHSLDVADEDDPSSNDEPFVILVRFRFQAMIGPSLKAKIRAGTLQVSAVGSAVHNNMGRSDDNWCDEDDDPYGLGGANLMINELVPTGQPGWVVGAVAVLFEEDAFSDGTANQMRKLILAEARKAIESMDFANINSNVITAPLVNKIAGQITSSLKLANLGLIGFLNGLAEAVDADDFAGVNVVLAATVPGGEMRMIAGQPPASAQALVLESVPVTGPKEFVLSFPAGDLSQVPSSARYQGQMAVRGRLSTVLVK